jgi:hypothetical protein
MRPILLGALAGALLLVSGCSDGPAEAGLSTCATLGPIAEIVDNHLPSGGDHVLVVPAQDVVSGVERTYDIRGDNVGHTHTVTLTADHFASLQRGMAITVVSTNNGPVGIGHDHTINLSCP